MIFLPDLNLVTVGHTLMLLLNGAVFERRVYRFGCSCSVTETGKQRIHDPCSGHFLALSR